MLWTYNSRSTTDLIQRWVQKQKFYATLPSKLDHAEQVWHEQQDDDAPAAEFTELPPDGSDAQQLLGGQIRARYTFFKEDE